jgi:hypothetical protein
MDVPKQIARRAYTAFANGDLCQIAREVFAETSG